MFDKLSIPVKGEPPRAAWGAGVANRLNELCTVAPAHMLIRDGATGTGFSPLPTNKRSRSGVRGYWNLIDFGNQTSHDLRFVNCIAQVGLIPGVDFGELEVEATDECKCYLHLPLTEFDSEGPSVASIITKELNEEIPPVDPETNAVNLYVGTIRKKEIEVDDENTITTFYLENGGIKSIPVIYRYN